MTEKTEHKNVYCALAAAQQNMGKVVKGAENPHFKSRYADLADVMNVALPALNAQGIACFATIESDGGSMQMRTTFYHGTTETSVHCDVPLLVAKSDSQGMKSATTYAKRIGIESLAGIAPEDDDAEVKAMQISTTKLTEAKTPDLLTSVWKALPAHHKTNDAIIQHAKDMRAAMDVEKITADLDGDGIPDFDKEPA